MTPPGSDGRGAIERLPSVGQIVERVAEVWERIIAAGGGPDRTTLVAVTKAFPVELAERAVAAGVMDLGENYAQELEAKLDALTVDDAPVPAPGPVRWHFIGGLQRNKVKRLAGRVHLWQSVDRASLVTELAKRDPGAAILVQVNTTGEGQKAGCDPTAAPELVERGREAGLDVRGLMTIGPTDGSADPRPAFGLLRRLAASCEVDQLSMGMSADFELAVAEGATMVRVGSTLFGPRPGTDVPSRQQPTNPK